MFSPISPEFVREIHKDKERELQSQIDQIRSAREQRALNAGSPAGQAPAWYEQAAQWIKVKVFQHAPVRQPEVYTKPCGGVPC